MAKHNPILDKARDVATQVESGSPAALESSEQAAANSQLAAIQQAIVEDTARTTSAITQLEEGSKQSAQAAQIIEQSITTANEANSIIQRTKLNAELEAQNTTIDAFEAVSGKAAQLALFAELKVDSDRVSDIRDQQLDIADDRITGIGIIDGVINSFRNVQNDLVLERAVAKANSTRKQITDIQAATESVAQTSALTKKTLNEGVIEANLRASKADGDAKLAQQRIVNINANSDMVAKIHAMKGNEIKNLIASFKLEGEAANRELSIERNKLVREELSIKREELGGKAELAQINLDAARLRLNQAQVLGPTQIATAEANLTRSTKSAQLLQDTQEEMTDAVRIGQSVTGVTVDENDATILARLQRRDPRYEAFFAIGSTGETAALGKTPADAKATLDIAAPLGNFARTKMTRLLDQVSILQSQNPPRTATKQLETDQKIIDADFNTKAKDLANGYIGNIKAGDDSNPYHAPPMTVLANVTDVRESVLFKKILEPLTMKEIDPQNILDAAVSGIRTGSITSLDAAIGIEILFDAAAALNNTQSGGFRRVGFPSQITYNSQVTREPTAFELLSGGVEVGIAAVVAPVRAIAGVLPSVTGAVENIEAAAERGFADRLFIVDWMDLTQVQAAIVISLSREAPELDANRAVEQTSEEIAASETAATEERERGEIF